MPRKWLRWMVLFFAAWMATAACSSASPAVAPLTANEAAGEAVEATTPIPTREVYHLYPLPDLTLIGATGRPQFIQSYADW